MGKKSFLLGALAAVAAAEAADRESTATYRTAANSPVTNTEYYVRSTARITVSEDEEAERLIRHIFDFNSYSDAIEIIDDITVGTIYGLRHITSEEVRIILRYIRKVGVQYLSPADRACKLYKLVK